MTIELQISSVFARYADNKTVVTVIGNTVGECLRDLISRYPDLNRIFLDKDGKLLHSYDIFINGKSAYPNEMVKPVRDGDKLHIVPVIYGG